MTTVLIRFAELACRLRVISLVVVYATHVYYFDRKTPCWWLFTSHPVNYDATLSF